LQKGHKRNYTLDEEIKMAEEMLNEIQSKVSIYGSQYLSRK